MAQNKRIFTLCLTLLIVISFMVPAYADVQSLTTDKTLYKKNTDTTMTFTGTADEEDIGEIVTVVIYDPGNNFMKPSHSAIVSFEKTFEIKISEKDFSKFTSHGIYNATAFMTDQQKADGVSITFDFSLDGTPVYHPTTQPAPAPTPTQSPTPTTVPISEPIPDENNDSTQSSGTTSDGKSIQDKINERIEAAKKQKESQTAPVTTGSTGETTSGTTSDTTTEEKPNTTSEKPDTTGISIPAYGDSNTLYAAIGLGAVGAAAAAIYRMQYKAKHKTRYSPESTSAEQTQLSSPHVQHEEDYALMILKNRLAKGEITIEEFNELKKALTES